MDQIFMTTVVVASTTKICTQFYDDCGGYKHY